MYFFNRLALPLTVGSISSTSASHIAANVLRSNHSNYYQCHQFSSIVSSLLSQWKYTTGWAWQNNQEERLEQTPICCLHQSLLGQVITIISELIVIIITVKHVLLYQSCSFLNIIQNAFDPPPPSFWTLGRFFLTEWETLCTALRLDNIRQRSEETMSNIPKILDNSILKESFYVNFK